MNQLLKIDKINSKYTYSQLTEIISNDYNKFYKDNENEIIKVISNDLSMFAKFLYTDYIFIDRDNNDKRYLLKDVETDLLEISFNFTEGDRIQECANKTGKKVKDGMTLRGNNPTMFITVLQDDGEMSDIITANEYLFQKGDDDIYLIRISSKMITDAVRYIEKEGKSELYFGKKHKYILKNMSDGDKINKIKRILIEKSKSSETPLPIMCDAKYGYEKGIEPPRR